MHSTQGFSSEAWMPIETLTSTDTSFTPLETGEIDVNKGGVALITIISREPPQFCDSERVEHKSAIMEYRYLLRLYRVPV